MGLYQTLRLYSNKCDLRRSLRLHFTFTYAIRGIFCDLPCTMYLSNIFSRSEISTINCRGYNTVYLNGEEIIFRIAQPVLSK
jgi:hypothetical protein